MKSLYVVLIGLFILLQYQLWFTPGGLTDIFHLHRQIGVLADENAKLKEKNAILAADVKDLKQGNEAVEERARNELGMVKKGEIFYQVVS